MINVMMQVNKEVFVDHIRPLIESELSCGWQHCDQNTLLVLLAATRRKFVSISSSFLSRSSLFIREIRLLY